jgi:hypothetical protein
MIVGLKFPRFMDAAIWNKLGKTERGRGIIKKKGIMKRHEMG